MLLINRKKCAVFQPFRRRTKPHAPSPPPRGDRPCFSREGIRIAGGAEHGALSLPEACHRLAKGLPDLSITDVLTGANCFLQELGTLGKADTQACCGWLPCPCQPPDCLSVALLLNTFLGFDTNGRL